MTEGEQLVLDDLNEFVRQTSNKLAAIPQSSGIRPHPVIESTEQTLDTTRFGMEFQPQPAAEVLPGGGGFNETFPPQGACCFGDGSCTYETEDECGTDGGEYQGDDVECIPNPCTTGACCVDSSCSIHTEAGCTNIGGTYQGDGTTCDPNPCLDCSCGFDAFDGSGRRFLTKHRYVVYGDNTGCLPYPDPACCPNPPSGVCGSANNPAWPSSFDYDATETYDPTDCSYNDNVVVNSFCETCCDGSNPCGPHPTIDCQSPFAGIGWIVTSATSRYSGDGCNPVVCSMYIYQELSNECNPV